MVKTGFEKARTLKIETVADTNWCDWHVAVQFTTNSNLLKWHRHTLLQVNDFFFLVILYKFTSCIVVQICPRNTTLPIILLAFMI